MHHQYSHHNNYKALKAFVRLTKRAIMHYRASGRLEYSYLLVFYALMDGIHQVFLNIIGSVWMMKILLSSITHDDLYL